MRWYITEIKTTQFWFFFNIFWKANLLHWPKLLSVLMDQNKGKTTLTFLPDGVSIWKGEPLQKRNNNTIFRSTRNMFSRIRLCPFLISCLFWLPVKEVVTCAVASSGISGANRRPPARQKAWQHAHLVRCRIRLGGRPLRKGVDLKTKSRCRLFTKRNAATRHMHFASLFPLAPRRPAKRKILAMYLVDLSPCQLPMCLCTVFTHVSSFSANNDWERKV